LRGTKSRSGYEKSYAATVTGSASNRERRHEDMTTYTENEVRGERAARTLDKMGDDYSSDREEAAVDLMADLLHMLDAWYGIEPEDAHRMAWHHFIEEREEN